jgi:hypothetical protein
MSKSKANPSESHDGMTWESLKNFHRTSSFTRPPLQQSDGLELVGKIDSLVHATHTACKEFRKTAVQSGDQDASPALELERQTEHLTPLWYEVFNCVREAEKWLSDTFGPAQSTLHLDSIAESMDQLFMMISECVPTEWGIGDDEEGALEDTLQKLHDIACELESSPKTAASKASDKKALKPSRAKAYAQHQEALRRCPELRTQDEIFAWLQENQDESGEDYGLPEECESWKKYFREAKKLLEGRIGELYPNQPRSASIQTPEECDYQYAKGND